MWLCVRSGTLSSYAYVLLCIGLLQQRSPPVLPNLQRLPGRPLNINGWDCSFCDDVEALKDFGKSASDAAVLRDACEAPGA